MYKKFKIVPRYLRLMKICSDRALCEYNRFKRNADKKTYYILNEAEWQVECSYKKHKKIGDPEGVLRQFIQNLIEKCEKYRLAQKLTGSRKLLEKYQANKVAFKKLVKIHAEMLMEIAQCQGK